MSEIEDRIRQAFKDEALDILSELETSLLELEKDPGDREAVSAVFRAFHTIKGSGAMSGFDEVSQFTHDIENIYDLVRSGAIDVDRLLIDLTLRSCDLIRGMISCRDRDYAQFQDPKEELLLSLRGLFPQGAGGRGKSKLPPCGLSPFISDDMEKSVTYRISFAPAPGILAKGTNPLFLLRELKELGDCSVTAYTDAIPDIGDMDPEACYLRWEAMLTTRKDINAVRDVFIFVEDDCKLSIDIVEEKKGPEGEIKRSFPEKKAGSPRKDPGGEVKTHVRSHEILSIKVSSQKLDSLVNLVGELVTVQARLSQASAMRDDPELVSISEEVERLTEEMRDTTMNVRMLPIGTLFSKFRRLVRDLSLGLGKEVEMAVDGAETELDKTVIEKLNDPMVHLIRNCIDHGIELPDAREETGKNRKGMVHLSARHSGADVLIRIRDDGAGLDAEAIRAEAVEKGLIPPDTELTEKEIFQLIFLPGFTTETSVTSVSGRGVGMDVVKRAVEALRGTVEVDSERGLGTAITLRLPLTLAIIEGLLVRVAEEMLVFPLSLVEECVELTSRDIARTGGRHIANIRGKVVPYVRLREQFVFGGRRPEIEQIVIVKENGNRVGFVVDQVSGQHQTVIKSLGKVLRDIDGISGATILGDGSVALILDIPRLLAIFEEEEVNRAG